MHPERDKQAVRAIGGVALGLGTILMLLTIIVTLNILLVTAGRGDVIRGAIAFAIGLVMASTLMSCGTQLQRLRLYTDAEVQGMRMAWAALMLVMVAGGLLSYWFIEPLTALAAFIIILLMLIRKAVIRLSH
jgi:hypothetical protein